jgi:hypothetical protein
MRGRCWKVQAVYREKRKGFEHGGSAINHKGRRFTKAKTVRAETERGTQKSKSHPCPAEQAGQGWVRCCYLLKLNRSIMSPMAGVFSGT